MRKILIKISVTVVLILFAIGTIHLFQNVILKEDTISNGIITIELEDVNGSKSEKKLEFYEGEYLYDVLKRNYTLRAEETQYGATIYDIDYIKTDFFTSYIAIYVNDEYSSLGASFISLKEGMKIRLLEVVL